MSDLTLTVLGMRLNGTIPFILLMAIIVISIAYLVSCASLYAFVQMFGIVEFSWMNGIYWAIIVCTLMTIFGSKGGN